MKKTTTLLGAALLCTTTALLADGVIIDINPPSQPVTVPAFGDGKTSVNPAPAQTPAPALPHTFMAGARAVASEVNANFRALLSAIQALTLRVDALENRLGPPAPAQQLTGLTPYDVPVGQTVVVGGVTYTMVSYQVPSLVEDATYYIKFPLAANAGLPVGVLSVRRGDIGQSSLVNPAQGIDGYRAAHGEGQSYDVSREIDPTGQAFVVRRAAIGTGLSIQLDADTYVSLGWNLYFKASALGDAQSADATRMRPDAVLPSAAQRAALVQQGHELYRYVRIGKIKA